METNSTRDKEQYKKTSKKVIEETLKIRPCWWLFWMIHYCYWEQTIDVPHCEYAPVRVPKLYCIVIIAGIRDDAGVGRPVKIHVQFQVLGWQTTVAGAIRRRRACPAAASSGCGVVRINEMESGRPGYC